MSISLKSERIFRHIIHNIHHTELIPITWYSK